MREIKFRAWDKDEKEMLPLGDMIENGGVSYFIGENDLQPQYKSIVLMQFTGLKDKNGKEIYEGDIVNYLYSGDEKLMVEWYDYEWLLATKEKKIISDFDWKECEVIGNIYENPELLNK